MDLIMEHQRKGDFHRFSRNWLNNEIVYVSINHSGVQAKNFPEYSLLFQDKHSITPHAVIGVGVLIVMYPGYN